MKLRRDKNINYLTVNAADRLWGLYTTTVGFQKIPPNTNYPPQYHPSAYWFNPNTGRVLDEFILLYITEGEGVFESSTHTPIKITAGNLLLLFPGEWHTYKPTQRAGWTEYWIGFNGHQITQLIDHQFFSENNPLFKVGFNEQFVSLYKQAIETANNQKTAYQQVLAGIVSMLLGLIIYAEKNNYFQDKAIISQIDRARLLMRENADREMTPAAIAASLNVSYSWFRKVFKQYTGFSPAQYQIEIKTQKAKELLTSTTTPVKEIALDLNFESVSYFVTFFKTKTGMSPTEYRRKVRGKV